uniref:DNA-directed primase/polymerase protein n=3 Tax=Rhodosorus marinus TaxID=101924 RepID=A0A7S3ACL7_9RHOD|mmetsp:Transcript_8448/g.37713  ORF Transcript_8448/g.37713 Transcript_8448/m.37713 type:complete len:347 (+) Transcript_8448:593-1633(+)
MSERKLKTVSSQSFYGECATAVPPVAQPESRKRLLEFLEDGFLLKEFKTQKEAFEFTNANPSNLMHVFAVEFEKSGKRLYVGASYSTFWKTYQRMKLRSQPLHFYEVIREGNSGKLYYDVEFSKDVNAERDGEKMVDDLLLETQRLLVHLFPSMMRGVDLNFRTILELDSSTGKKFSRHLILPQVNFRSNEEAGVFVKELCRRCMESQKEFIRVVDTSGESETTFVDQAVYTKNRCFRLLGSSKYGRSTPLVFTERSPYAHRLDEQVFLKSLVCNVSPLEPCLSIDDLPRSKAGSRMATRTLAVNGQHGSRGPSPYPHVDAIIEKLISLPNHKVWQYTEQRTLLRA